MNKLILFIEIMCILTLITENVNAYSVESNGEVHQYLTNESSVVWKLIPYEIKKNLGSTINVYDEENNFDIYEDYILSGSAEEDYDVNPKSHFWQPDNNTECIKKLKGDEL